MTRRKRALVITGLCVVLIMAGWLVWRDRIYSRIGDYLIIADPLAHADVIHVIAGDDYRTEYAIQLYQQGYGEAIFFTGGWCTYHNYYHGEHGMQLALERGVPREAIIFDDSPVLSTYDETLLVKNYLDAQGILDPTIMVVSDPFHMRRAQWTNRHIFKDHARLIMAPVPFDQTPFVEEWWSDAHSRHYVISEYEKIIYYYFRYQLSWTWISALDER